MNTILGKKVQQSQAFLENGNRIPVTLVVTNDNPVVGIKSLDKDGYSAIQVGFGKTKHPNKPLLGHAKKASLTIVPKVLKEIKTDTSFQLGDVIKVEDVLKPGDIVDVTGQSKGKGFAGGVKRHQFKGGPRTHGQSDRERAPGSIGQTTTPGRVYKGKRMAGNMGNERVTVKNLMVIDVNSGDKSILIKGLVPGVFGGIVSITKTGEVKEKNFVPLFKLEDQQSEVIVEESPVQKDVSVSEPTEEVKTEEVTAVEETVPAEEVVKVEEATEEEAK